MICIFSFVCLLSVEKDDTPVGWKPRQSMTWIRDFAAFLCKKCSLGLYIAVINEAFLSDLTESSEYRGVMLRICEIKDGVNFVRSV